MTPAAAYATHVKPMQLNWMDWTIVALYFAFSLAAGLYFSRRAGRSMESYFLSGRSMPWWLLGVSMVATTFAADTPLAVTAMVAENGVAGNWLWWNLAFSGILTVFLYARLWRRSGVLTDVEFAEIRYHGKPAAFLRGFRALYLALPINCIIMGWVTLGMSKVLALTLGIGKTEAIVACLAVTILYSTLSGLWGVLITDFVQFFIALTGSVALAYFAVDAAGGIANLKERLEGLPMEGSPLAFIPDVGSAWMPLTTFLVYIAVNWWAAWYPGAEPGGGGYIAQRIFSAKDERHGLAAAFFFNFAHYALRPWPWILVALAALVLYPDIEDKEAGYVMVMVDHLPHFFRGLLLATFMAAYMSTISTHLNWGASYLVNDFYRRFLKPSADERHYVRVSRIATLVIMVAAAVVTYFMDTVAGAWRFLLAIGAGTGPVYLLRWYWWRINAWSEVSAMLASLAASLSLQLGLGYDSDDPLGFARLMLWTVAISSAVWLTVTLATGPEPQEKLASFFRRVRPAPALWGPVARLVPEVEGDQGLGWALLDWMLGCVFVFCALFGIGKIVLQEYLAGALYLAAGAAALAWIFGDLRGTPPKGRERHAKIAPK